MNLQQTSEATVPSRYVTEEEIAARLEIAQAINKAAHELNKRTHERRGTMRTFVTWFAKCNPCADPLDMVSEPGKYTVVWSDGWTAVYLHNPEDGITNIRYSVPGERGTFEVPVPTQEESIQ